MKKITEFLLITTLIMSFSAPVLADDSGDEMMERSEKRMEMKMKMKEVKEVRNIEIDENRMQMKENRMHYKDENKQFNRGVFKSFDDDTKSAIKSLSEETKTEIKTLRENLRDSDDKEAILEQMKNLHATQIEKMKELLSDNTEALEVLENRIELFENNRELRMKNKKARIEYRGERSEIVEKYKTSFVKRIGNRLDSISDGKLEMVLEKIEVLIKKYEENEDISDDRKDKVVSQLVALQEIIEEKLEGVEEDILDIDDLLED